MVAPPEALRGRGNRNGARGEPRRGDGPPSVAPPRLARDYASRPQGSQSLALGYRFTAPPGLNTYQFRLLFQVPPRFIVERVLDAPKRRSDETHIHSGRAVRDPA